GVEVVHEHAHGGLGLPCCAHLCASARGADLACGDLRTLTGALTSGACHSGGHAFSLWGARRGGCVMASLFSRGASNSSNLSPFFVEHKGEVETKSTGFRGE